MILAKRSMWLSMTAFLITFACAVHHVLLPTGYYYPNSIMLEDVACEESSQNVLMNSLCFWNRSGKRIRVSYYCRQEYRNHSIYVKCTLIPSQDEKFAQEAFILCSLQMQGVSNTVRVVNLNNVAHEGFLP